VKCEDPGVLVHCSGEEGASRLLDEAGRKIDGGMPRWLFDVDGVKRRVSDAEQTIPS